MKEFIMTVINTLKDKDLDWQFKLLNILTNDWLRNELAFTRLHVYEAREACTEYMEERPLKRHIVRNLDRAIECIDEIWGNAK